PDLLAAPEDLEGGDAGDAVAGGHLRVLVDVELDDADPALVLGGDLVEDRRHLLARAAPLRPEVDDDGDVGAEHLRVEGGVGDLGRSHGGLLSSVARNARAQAAVALAVAAGSPAR